MTILPREQVTQRHPAAAIGVPGATLWVSQTNLATCDVDVLDEVEEWELDIVFADPYGHIFDVEYGAEFTGYGFGVDEFGEWPFGEGGPVFSFFDMSGVWQDTEFGEGDFGAGNFGGVETEYADDRGQGPLIWGESDEVVYP